MKKKMLLISATLISAVFSLPAQITSRQVAEKSESQQPVYDSLENIMTYENCRQYIGQSIYVIPKSKLDLDNTPKEMSGYRGFATMMGYTGNEKDYLYKAVQEKDERGYPSKYSYISGYDGLAGKYFKVIDVIDNTENSESDRARGMHLKLESMDDHTTLYFKVAHVKQHFGKGIEGPFVFTGYFEKLKQLNLKKKFIAQKNIPDLNDINNGKPVACPEGSEWTCTEVTFIDTKGWSLQLMVFIFKNTAGQEIAVGARYRVKGLMISKDDFKTEEQVLLEKKKKEEELQKQLIEEKEKRIQDSLATIATAAALKLRRAELIKKYGPKYGALIADEKVAMGMTKKMCTEAWGEPDHINITTNNAVRHEQWVYNLRSYLYFDNNILTTIQSTQH